MTPIDELINRMILLNAQWRVADDEDSELYLQFAKARREYLEEMERIHK